MHTPYGMGISYKGRIYCRELQQVILKDYRTHVMIQGGTDAYVVTLPRQKRNITSMSIKNMIDHQQLN